MYEWQQAEAEAVYLIQHLTRPGDLVIDPMMGAGTTIAAVLKLGRKAIGIDVDPQSRGKGEEPSHSRSPR